MRETTVSIEFKKEDAWIGAFWKQHTGYGMRTLDIWICVVPMFPIHITMKGLNHA